MVCVFQDEWGEFECFGEVEVMEILDFIDKQASAIFGILGTVIGFFGNYFLQKINQKFEITKDVAQDYYKGKKIVLTKTLQLISNYEFEIKTLHDFIEDDKGVPIGMFKKEDIYTNHFLLIFEYLHSNRIYLEDETIKKLDNLVSFYHNYILHTKVIKSEMDPDDMILAIESEKQKLFDETEVLFNGLLEQIKFDEIKNFKAKMENK